MSSRATGTAYSAKTLNTNTQSRIDKSTGIVSTAQKYFDDIVNFNGDSMNGEGIYPDMIKKSVVDLAVPASTTPRQMEALRAAAVNAGLNDIELRITLIQAP